MKKYVSLLVVLSLVLVLSSVASAAGNAKPIKLYMNGVQLKTDVAPQIIDKYTMVPIAILSESLHFDYSWDSKTKKLNLTKGKSKMELTMGQSYALVNGKKVVLQTSPKLVEQRVLVPVRFVSEQFGVKVNWWQQEQEVHLLKERDDSNLLQSTGQITDISFDGKGKVVVQYKGGMLPEKPSILAETGKPKRIILRYPGTRLSQGLAEKFKGGLVEVKPANNPILHSYRYTHYTHDPVSANLVLVVSENINVKVTHKQGELTYTLSAASGTSSSGGSKQTPKETPKDTSKETSKDTSKGKSGTGKTGGTGQSGNSLIPGPPPKK